MDDENPHGLGRLPPDDEYPDKYPRVPAPHGMGRVPSEFDVRNYNLKDFIPKQLISIPKTEMAWEFPAEKPLDQDMTSHCVGFMIANWGINLPTWSKYTNDDGHKFYYLCKDTAGEPRDETGSTVHAAAKLLKDTHRIEAYAFATDIAVIKYWLLNRGPVMVGTAWTDDMFTADSNNVIHPTGGIAGGHGYLLNEYRKDNYFGIQNSWGDTWGVNGKAYIAVDDWAKLFAYDGEAVAAVELENYQVKKPCWLVDLFKWFRE